MHRTRRVKVTNIITFLMVIQPIFNPFILNITDQTLAFTCLESTMENIRTMREIFQNLNRLHTLFWCFNCWFQISKCRPGKSKTKCKIVFPLFCSNLWFYHGSWSQFMVKPSRTLVNPLTFSWRRFLSYKNHSIDLRSKSKNWFLYDKDLRHEIIKLLKSSNDKNGFVLHMYTQAYIIFHQSVFL